jgi:hypothetical protein
MLQFLQCKTFGNQAVPKGWIIAAAGNPPEYNKSVRDFDIVTLDRVKRMDIEPDYPAFKAYAHTAGIHPAILSYLELHPNHFYQIQADVDGTQFVTARGWEDLSNLLETYETLEISADEAVIRQYLQHREIAEDFAAYLDLYEKYRDDYGVEEILTAAAKPAVFARALQAPFDERLALVSLLLAGLERHFAAVDAAAALADGAYALLKTYKARLVEESVLSPANVFAALYEADKNDLAQKQTAGLLDKDTLAARRALLRTEAEWLHLLQADGTASKTGASSGEAAFSLLKSAFAPLADSRAKAEDAASAALEHAFDFMEQAFAEGQEMVVFVTELTLSPAAQRFLTANGCPRYFQYNKALLLDSRRDALQRELAKEEFSEN